jgi:U3 small nucleolar ribonucleoprotein protein IMP4
MLITSSRKPSPKTRLLCKLLSRFIACRRITRGKMGMQELMEFTQNGPFIVVGEYHGNPGELSFYDGSRKLLFSLRFVGWYSQRIDSYLFSDVKPILIGQGEIAKAFELFFQFKRIESDKIDEFTSRSILIVIEGKDIYFMGSGKCLFSLSIKGFKKY